MEVEWSTPTTTVDGDGDAALPLAALLGGGDEGVEQRLVLSTDGEDL